MYANRSLQSEKDDMDERNSTLQRESKQTIKGLEADKATLIGKIAKIQANYDALSIERNELSETNIEF